MKKSIASVARFVIPWIFICLPFFLAYYFTDNLFLRLSAIAVAIIGAYIYKIGAHREDFDESSKFQKAVLAAAMIILVLFSFFMCAVSIEKEWIYDYPLKGGVDKYGCYPQMFDAFQKGQLNIDTDYDLSILEKLENPYNTAERRQATGEKYGVIWDRAYFDGKLYSYFGIAPVIFLYYPAYFLTGHVLSDALAAAIMTAVGAVLMFKLLIELCKRMKNKPPFLLVLICGVTLPCGALLWTTEVNANFYHLAVLSGICAVCAFFLYVLKADACDDGWKRKVNFAIAGVCVAAIVASRPNLVIYILIAFPLLFSIIKSRPFGTKSLLADIAAFCVPMFALGGLIMAYNAARFGSPFDFGANYQLTLADPSPYSLSGALALPAMYHFFLQSPLFDGNFPFLHPNVARLGSYDVDRVVYVSSSVGSAFFPITWGAGAIALLWKESKRKFIAAAIALLCVIFIAVFDLCFGGVHLRYAADVMFVLTLLGAYLLLSAVSRARKGSAVYVALYTAVIVCCLITVLVAIPLVFDNERDMILKYHKEFYLFFKS